MRCHSLVNEQDKQHFYSTFSIPDSAFSDGKGTNMRKIFILTVMLLCSAMAAQAAVVAYTLPVPGVV